MHENEIATAADLGRRNAERTVTGYDLREGSSLLVTRLRDDEKIDVRSLEKHLAAPTQPRGQAVLHDPSDWVEYVNRVTNEATTTVWADVNTGTLTAVLDDHTDSAYAGWREHRVALTLRTDLDWHHWARNDGKSMTQTDFAEHLDAATHTIVSPDAATMVEIATSFRATKSLQVQSEARLDNGDVKLSFMESTDAKAGKRGDVEIPSEFELLLSPWVGVAPVPVRARLAYDVSGQKLYLRYHLHRPDLVKQVVFGELVSGLREDLVTDAVFNGHAPEPLR